MLFGTSGCLIVEMVADNRNCIIGTSCYQWRITNSLSGLKLSEKTKKGQIAWKAAGGRAIYFCCAHSSGKPMADISCLAESSGSKFRALNKWSDVWRAYTANQSQWEELMPSCLSKSGHLSLKHILGTRPFLIGFTFPSGQMEPWPSKQQASGAIWKHFSVKPALQPTAGICSERTPRMMGSTWTSQACWQDQPWAPGPIQHIFRCLDKYIQTQQTRSCCQSSAPGQGWSQLEAGKENRSKDGLPES